MLATRLSATFRRTRIGVTAALWPLLLATPGFTRSAGIAAVGCDACHQGTRATTVTLTSAPEIAAIGDAITLTIRVASMGSANAGFYLTTAHHAPGVFEAIDPGTVATATEVMHSAPRLAADGSATFTAKWTATQASGVVFDVYAVTGNGDRSNRGDSAATGKLELVVGCTGSTYYIDQDGDGYGSTDPAYSPRKDCNAPAGYAASTGDCDDFRAAVYPGAVEQCDLKDNDCDGQVDEEVVDQPYCEDRDGDGHGVKGGMMKVDCKPSAGFGDCAGDCDDRDEDVFPGAMEACDGRDNNCDSKVDEGVRKVCGVGLCSRSGVSCMSTCTPGPPSAELCNGYDDDCDGVIDNGSNELLCGSLNVPCVGGRCQDDGGAGGGAAGGSAAPNPTPSGAPGLGTASAASCSLQAPKASAPPAWGIALLLALASRRRSSRGLRKGFFG